MNAKLQDLSGSRVYFDANPIIYYIEESGEFSRLVTPLFEGIATDHIQAFTSEFTLCEVLFKPTKMGAQNIIAAHKALLFDEDLFTLTPTSRHLFLSALELSAETGLQMIDALHLQSAIDHQCHYFVTNDKRLKTVRGLEVVQLSLWL
jgi:predicted nucleic acid-binding protein